MNLTELLQEEAKLQHEFNQLDATPDEWFEVVKLDLEGAQARRNEELRTRIAWLKSLRAQNDNNTAEQK